MTIYELTDKQSIASDLKDNKIGILPTDTLYGLACSANSKQAVARLYSLKKRQAKPGTVIAASIDQLVHLGIPRRYLTAVMQYWPNPISIIIASTPELVYLDQGKMSLAVRIPSDPKITDMLKITGPLLTSSANLPGEKPASNVHEAQGYFGNQVDFYVDGGDLFENQASTIIRIIDDAVEVIREGAVKISERG